MFRYIYLSMYFQLLEYKVICGQVSIKPWIFFHYLYLLPAMNKLSPYFTSLSQNLVLPKLCSLTFPVDVLWCLIDYLALLWWQLKTNLSLCAHSVVFCPLCWSCIALMANSEVIWCRISNIDIKSLPTFKRKDHRVTPEGKDGKVKLWNGMQTGSLTWTSFRNMTFWRISSKIE